MRFILQSGGLFAAVVGCLSLSSCGPRGEVALTETGATLEGTVTYGGEKVTALIILVGSGGSAQSMSENGTYKIENAPLGEVTIGVNVAAAKGMLSAPGAKKGLKVIDVPKKYEDPNGSPIKTTVSKGPNHFDIVVPK